MKNIKQIRQKYDAITESKEHEANKLKALVRAGLFEENKLPIVKRALSKDPSSMTIAERRVAMGLLESLMTDFLSQNYEQLNEKADKLSKFDPRFKTGYPEDKDMPVVLILKRKAIRVYPDNQKVALYYSQALDKYVTVPFGPNTGSLNEEDAREKNKSPYVIQRTTTKKREQFISPKHEKAFRDVSSTIKDYEDNLAAGKYDADPNAKKTVERNLLTAKKRLEDINKRKKVTIKARTRNIDLASIQPKQMTKREYKTFQSALSKDADLNIAHKAAAKFGAFVGRKLGPTGSTRQKLLGSPTVTGAVGKGIADVAKSGVGAVKKVFKEEDTAKYRFRQRLNERRQLQKEDAVETLKDITPFLGTYRSGTRAKEAFDRGDYGQAALHGGLTALGAAGDIAIATGVGSLAGAGLKAIAAKGGQAIAARGAARGAPAASTKAATPSAATGASSTGTATNTAAGAAGAAGAATARTAAKTATKGGPKGGPKGGGRNRLMARAATGAGIGAGLAAGGSNSNEPSIGPRQYDFKLQAQTSKPQFQRTSSVSNPTYDVRTTSAWNQAQQTVREERAFDVVKKMTEQKIDEAVINIGGNTIKINSLIANKINNLYESLNDDNKEKMVSILNESADSFKKILDFAVRQ